MTELLPLAIASAFWPALLAVALVSLRAPKPGRLLVGFLAAGLLTTMTIGLAVIYALKGTDLVSSARHSFDPAVQIAAGSLALLAAIVLRRRRATPSPAPETHTPSPGRIERMLERGAPLAFVAGIVLNVIPGVAPLIALKNIAELDEGPAATVALLLGFYLIMFALIEIPLAGYLIAPAWTAQATPRFNTWLDRNARRLALYALGIVGIYLVVRGIVGLVD